MRALLVDDDDNYRSVVRRVLTRRFESLEVVECRDGVEALDRLSKSDFAIVLLDVQMPMMDGFDVLQSIRQSRALREIPVAMMTGFNDEATVKRALKLGVSDFIVKPIRPTQLCERVLRMVTRSSTGSSRSGTRHAFKPLVLNRTTPIMIVDGNSEFREFFRRTMTPLCTVEEAASGLEAFRRCLEKTPAAVFVGQELGIVSPELLIRRLRDVPRFTSVRVIGIEPERTLRQVRRAGLFEAVIMQSFVPDIFLEGIASLTASPEASAHALGAVPDLKLLVISVAEESLSAALGQHVVLRPLSLRAPSHSVAALTVLHVGEDQVPLIVQVSAAVSHASAAGARMVAAGVPEAATPDEVLRSLTDRLGWAIAAELQGRGLAVVVAPSNDVRVHQRRGPMSADDDQRVTLGFEIPGEKLVLRVEVFVAPQSDERDLSAPRAMVKRSRTTSNSR